MGDFDVYIDPILEVKKDGKIRHIYGVIEGSVPQLSGKHERAIFIDYLLEKNLITLGGNGYNEWEYKITPFGYHIITSGGWIKYLETLDNLKKQAERKDRNRFRWSIWVSAVASLIALGSLALDFFQSRDTNEVEKSQAKQLQRIDSISKATNDRFESLKRESSTSKDSIK